MVSGCLILYKNCILPFAIYSLFAWSYQNLRRKFSETLEYFPICEIWQELQTDTRFVRPTVIEVFFFEQNNFFRLRTIFRYNNFVLPSGNRCWILFLSDSQNLLLDFIPQPFSVPMFVYCISWGPSDPFILFYNRWRPDGHGHFHFFCPCPLTALKVTYFCSSIIILRFFITLVRLRFISLEAHLQNAVAQCVSIQWLYRNNSIFVVSHCYESESLTFIRL